MFGLLNNNDVIVVQMKSTIKTSEDAGLLILENKRVWMNSCCCN